MKKVDDTAFLYRLPCINDNGLKHFRSNCEVCILCCKPIKFLINAPLSKTFQLFLYSSPQIRQRQGNFLNNDHKRADALLVEHFV